MDHADLRRRFNHHPPINQVVSHDHQSIRYACLELATTIDEIVPEGREKSLAITKLEEVMFWANAGIARNQPVTNIMVTNE